MTAAPFRILAVCTANICRSPAVEHLLRKSADPSRVLVSSAGTRAVPGLPMDPAIERLLQLLGAETEGFVTQPLTEVGVLAADLILTSTRSQRSQVVSLDAGALARTFTMREFIRLTRQLPALEQSALTHPGELVASAFERRHAAAFAADDDIVDPYRRGHRAYRDCVAETERCVGELVSALQAEVAAR